MVRGCVGAGCWVCAQVHAIVSRWQKVAACVGFKGRVLSACGRSCGQGLFKAENRLGRSCCLGVTGTRETDKAACSEPCTALLDCSRLSKNRLHTTPDPLRPCVSPFLFPPAFLSLLQPKIVRLLLETGPWDLKKIANVNGDTALHAAVQAQAPAALGFLFYLSVSCAACLYAFALSCLGVLYARVLYARMST